MSKIKRITVSNLKAISSLTADFNGCTAIITGGNNKGKSSFLRSLPDRLRQVKPDVILKHGESEGFKEIELTTGEKLIWEFDNKTKAGEKLKFITKDNITTSLTREIANRYFPKTFDIDRFLNVGPSEQKKMLQSIVGIDFSDIDARYKEAYEDRTAKNRLYEHALASKIEKVEGAPEEKIDVSELHVELSKIDAHNERYDSVMEKMDMKEATRDSYLLEIEQLKNKINELEGSVKELDEDIRRGSDWLLNPNNTKKTEKDKKEIKDKINEAHRLNELFDLNLKAFNQDVAIGLAFSEKNTADKLVKEIEKEKSDLIKSANMPDGFEFTDDGVTYLGHTLSKEQLSSSAVYIAALKLASLNLGEVKTLHFDASFLDKNSLKEIENWANQNNLQLLIERPDFDGGEIEYQLLTN